MTITAYSIPIYDTWNNWYYGVEHWSCEHWLRWFEEMEKEFGLLTAKDTWVSAWNHADNSEVNSMSAYCRYNCIFVRFMYQKGISIGNLVSQSYCDVSDIIQETANTVVTVAQGAKKSSNALSYIIPLGVVYLIYRYGEKG